MSVQRICFLAALHDAVVRDPARYLDDIHLHRFLPQVLAKRGYDVRFVKLAPNDARYYEGGVDYHFVAEPAFVRKAAARAGRALGRQGARLEPGVRTLRRVASMNPDIVHVHGLDLYFNVALTRLLVRRRGARLVMHYHGGYPSRQPVARALQRFSLSGVSRYLFTAEEQAQPFMACGMIARPDHVVQFMELSSPFEMQPRSECRAETGMTGRPVFVWTGRLHPIKDPLTALKGFERIAVAWPEAALYMYYRSGELQADVQSYVESRPNLRERVHLRGPAPYPRMEAIYNSADFLLQASRREFSGCAVLEALSCGVYPVVTDLPPFRAMTSGGRIGVLFPAGNAQALADGVLSLAPDAASTRARAVRAHFERELSYDALGSKLDAVYQDILA